MKKQGQNKASKKIDSDQSQLQNLSQKTNFRKALGKNTVPSGAANSKNLKRQKIGNDLDLNDLTNQDQDSQIFKQNTDNPGNSQSCSQRIEQEETLKSQEFKVPLETRRVINVNEDDSESKKARDQNGSLASYMKSYDQQRRYSGLQDSQIKEKKRIQLAKKTEAIDYIKYMINCKLQPNESDIAPQFNSMFQKLTIKNISYIKNKLRFGIRDNKHNQDHVLFFETWQKFLRGEQPDVTTMVTESLRNEKESFFKIQNSVTESQYEFNEKMSKNDGLNLNQILDETKQISSLPNSIHDQQSKVGLKIQTKDLQQQIDPDEPLELNNLISTLCEPFKKIGLFDKLKLLSEASTFMSNFVHWEHALSFKKFSSDQQLFHLKDFIKEALKEICMEESNYKNIVGLILVIPIAMQLFDQGHKNALVIQCANVMKIFPKAKDDYRLIIKLVFGTSQIVEAFTDCYQYLNPTAIEYLKTAHKKQKHLNEIKVQIPFLRYLKVRDQNQQMNVFAWASIHANLIENTIISMSRYLPELSEHIKEPEHTDLFIKFFKNSRLNCIDTYTKGRNYWIQIIKEEELAWEQKVKENEIYCDYDEIDVKFVKDGFKKFGLSTLRNKDQLNEIFTIFERAQKSLMIPQRLVNYAQCGSGKTENLKIIISSLSNKFENLKIVLALPNNLILEMIAESFSDHGVIFQRGKIFDENKENKFEIGITITTHEVVASYIHHGGPQMVRDTFLFVDELDMACPSKQFGFQGAEYFMNATFFYGSTANELNNNEKEAFNCETFGTIFTSSYKQNDKQIDRQLDVVTDQEAIKHIRKKRISGEKVVIFCNDVTDAKKRYEQITNIENDSKDNYFMFDPEINNKSEINKTIKFLKTIELNEKVDCIFTWQIAIRGINYWKECYPIAWFDLKSKVDYQQFMGRSNRNFPNCNLQKGTVIVKKKLDQLEFEKTLM